MQWADLDFGTQYRSWYRFISYENKHKCTFFCIFYSASINMCTVLSVKGTSRCQPRRSFSLIRIHFPRNIIVSFGCPFRGRDGSPFDALAATWRVQKRLPSSALIPTSQTRFVLMSSYVRGSPSVRLQGTWSILIRFWGSALPHIGSKYLPCFPCISRRRNRACHLFNFGDLCSTGRFCFVVFP